MSYYRRRSSGPNDWAILGLFAAIFTVGMLFFGLAEPALLRDALAWAGQR